MNENSLIKKFKILIFPAGAENAIEIYYSLINNIHLDVYGLSGKADHAKFLYPDDHYFEGNYYINDKDFLLKFNDLIINNSIDLIIPTHDSIALFLSEHRTDIFSTIAVSDFQTTKICREKKLIYQVFKKYDFCPEVFSDINEINNYPVFVKPNRGEGSKGTFIAWSKSDFVNIEHTIDDYVLCEYLPGDEITVDCFTNKDTELLFIGPRSRERIQMGISFHSETIPVTDEIVNIANRINYTLNFRGAWFFQLKKDSKQKYKLLEISARQAGTMTVYRHLGVNFALLSVYDFLGQKVEIIKNSMQIKLDRCLQNRFKIDYSYDYVYVDFDDTIIFKEEVNSQMMALLYELKNKHKNIILITKHEYDIQESLQKHNISNSLFTEIISVPPDQYKYLFIKNSKSIFIDNHFIERKMVFENLRIPVFDIDAIDCLLI